jgi:hypothetical protein
MLGFPPSHQIQLQDATPDQGQSLLLNDFTENILTLIKNRELAKVQANDVQ